MTKDEMTRVSLDDIQHLANVATFIDFIAGKLPDIQESLKAIEPLVAASIALKAINPDINEYLRKVNNE